MNQKNSKVHSVGCQKEPLGQKLEKMVSKHPTSIYRYKIIGNIELLVEIYQVGLKYPPQPKKSTTNQQQQNQIINHSAILYLFWCCQIFQLFMQKGEINQIYLRNLTTWHWKLRLFIWLIGLLVWDKDYINEFLSLKSILRSG